MALPSPKTALKSDVDIHPAREPSLMEGNLDEVEELEKREEHEVFQKSTEGVDFRTVTWQRAIIIMLKLQVATGLLGIPGALYSLGAVGGGISIVAWQALNTCACLCPEAVSLVLTFMHRHKLHCD